MAKNAKKSAGGARKGGRRHRKNKSSFKTWISRVNKASKRGLTLSSKAAKVIDGFLQDQFDRIATQAAALARANKRSTIRAAEIQTAVRLSLPAELAKHAILKRHPSRREIMTLLLQGGIEPNPGPGPASGPDIGVIAQQLQQVCTLLLAMSNNNSNGQSGGGSRRRGGNNNNNNNVDQSSSGSCRTGGNNNNNNGVQRSGGSKQALKQGYVRAANR